MAQMTIEFYHDGPATTNQSAVVEGTLISSVDVPTATTSVAHAAVPDEATYAVVVTDFEAFIEIGNGNQDVTSARRIQVPAGSARGFKVKPTDTLSYRSVV